MTVPQPYVPFAPSSVLRMFYLSTCQVLRLDPALGPAGAMTFSWVPVDTIVDPVLNQPGLLQCRLDLTFLRPGKDQPAPIVAGRAPDRTGVCYFDLTADANGAPLVKSADRLQCVAGPVFGTFEIRLVPDVAQDLTGAHHIEVQVVETSQMLKQGSPMPFPGVAPLCPSTSSTST
jgi:hypothetical protein